VSDKDDVDADETAGVVVLGGVALGVLEPVS
jgi:hypothetical protein